MKPFILVVVLAIGGCVTSMYHAAPGSSPALSAYAANRACVPEVQTALLEHPPGMLVPGFFPALLVGSVSSSQSIVNSVEDACMAHYGWFPNG